MDVSNYVTVILNGMMNEMRLKENEMVSVLIGTHFMVNQWSSIFGLLKHWPLNLVRYLKEELVLKRLIEAYFEMHDDVPVRFLKVSHHGQR